MIKLSFHLRPVLLLENSGIAAGMFRKEKSSDACKDKILLMKRYIFSLERVGLDPRL